MRIFRAREQPRERLGGSKEPGIVKRTEGKKEKKKKKKKKNRKESPVPAHKEKKVRWDNIRWQVGAR